MRLPFVLPLLGAVALFSAYADTADNPTLQVKVSGQDLMEYQATPLSAPKGGVKFKGSNFIHPLKTPSGFVVTDCQPADHLHHFGLWWPWKYIEIEGRKVLCWELQNGDGLIQAVESQTTEDGFTAKSNYIDRKAAGGPQTILNETLHVKTSEIVNHPVRGYYLDLEIIHEVAGDKPVKVLKYRYSGFALRATSQWKNDNSRVLTSEGKDRDSSNFTRAKWVRVEGQAQKGHRAGVLLMSCRDNYDHPELLRTWDRKSINGSVFINFNSVQEKGWLLEPGNKYTRNFRVFVYDGTLSSEKAEEMWNQYMRTRAAPALHAQAPAADRKPVKVFILLGQSNMLGAGKIKGGEGSLEHAVKEKKLYPYLIDDRGAWTVRKDVRNVRVMGSGTGAMRVFNNEWMGISGGKIGPEIGIGQHVGQAIDEPVLILKSCIGNRALGWDLLPPGSESFEFTDKKGATWVHPGYKGSPERWKKGEEPKKIGWYAGMQYDGDIARAKKVLAELDTYFPGAEAYEVAGFFWWQGDRDSRSAALASRYEKNLVHLIKQLRKDFDAPEAKFVCATLGQTQKGAEDNGGKLLDAMFAVDGKSGKYPEFKGNVAAVYSHPLSKGGSSGGHYSGNAETYMNVGEAMGKAMVELLENK